MFRDNEGLGPTDPALFGVRKLNGVSLLLQEHLEPPPRDGDPDVLVGQRLNRVGVCRGYGSHVRLQGKQGIPDFVELLLIDVIGFFVTDVPGDATHVGQVPVKKSHLSFVLLHPKARIGFDVRPFHVI